MPRSLLAACVVSLVLAAAGAGPAAGENQNEDYYRRIDDCRMLIYRFDLARTDNRAAIALRDAAENNCLDARDNLIDQGTEQIREALRMIGSAS